MVYRVSATRTNDLRSARRSFFLMAAVMGLAFGASNAKSPLRDAVLMDLIFYLLVGGALTIAFVVGRRRGTLQPVGPRWTVLLALPLSLVVTWLAWTIW